MENKTKLLKVGDRIRMRAEAPRYIEQGTLKDGTLDTGTITNNNHSTDYPYTVNWDGGRRGYCYSDEHLELAPPKDEVINNYQIF